MPSPRPSLDVELLFPPVFKNDAPYVALPVLAGFLQSRGFTDLRLADLNLDYTRYLMEDAVLAECEADLRWRAETGDAWADGEAARIEAALVRDALAHLPVLRRWLPDTLERFRLQRDPARLATMPRARSEREAAQVEVVFDMLGDVWSARFHPWRIENLVTRREVFLTHDGWSRRAYNNLAWRDVFGALRSDRNPFLAFFRRRVLPGLIERRPAVVGLSLMFREQCLAAFTLADLVREALPDTHVCVGGALFSDLEHYLYTAPAVREAVFDRVHSIVLGPGEVPLMRLLQRMTAGGALDDIPNVLTACNVAVSASARAEQPARPEARSGPVIDAALLEARASQTTVLYAQSVLPGPGPSGAEADPLRVLPTRFESGAARGGDGPVPRPIYFDGDLDRYFYRSAEITVPFLASYGCYWNRCTFCKYREQVHAYRRVPLDELIAQLRHFSARFGTRTFHFNDETLSPAFCRQFSERLLRDGLDLRWSGNARFDPGFEPAVVEAMKASGCRYISFGLESASPRMIALMDKGTDIATVERTMAHFAEAGLPVALYLFFGFPGETPDDLRCTLRFLERHREVICDLSVGRFSLYKGTGVFRTPARYGIQSIDHGDLADPDVLMWSYDFTLDPDAPGHDRDAATRMYFDWHRETFGSLGPWFSTDGSV